MTFELLGHDEVDETQARRPEGRGQDRPHRLQWGVLLRLDGFASAGRWGRTFTGKFGQPTGGLNDLQLL